MAPPNMAELKTERSSLKRKLSVLSTRLNKSINQSLSPSAISSTYAELESTYLDFTAVDEEYGAAIDDDPSLEEEFAKVNDLTLEDYTSSVETIYQDAKAAYVKHEQALLNAAKAEKSAANLQKVRADTKFLKTSIEMVTRREQMAMLESEDDLKEGKEEVNHILKKVQDLLREAEAEEQWANEAEAVLNLVREANALLWKIKGKLRAMDGGSVSSIHSVSSTSVPTTTTATTSDSVPSVTAATPTTMVPASSSGFSTGTVCTTSVPPTDVTYSNPDICPPTTNTSSNPTSEVLTPAQQLFRNAGSTTWMSQPSSSMALSYSPYSMYGNQSASGNSSQTLAQSYLYGCSFHPPASTMQANVSSHPPASSAPLMSPSIAPSSFQGHAQPDVRVKRVSLPTFSGERCDWPEFRAMWPKLAIPAFQNRETLAKELRDCMVGEQAKEKLGKIAITGPQSFDIMWNKLCVYYDDVGASVDDALKKLHSLRSVREEDYKGIVKLVDEVENSYCQLINFDQLNCLTNRDVDEVVEKLPMVMRREWNKVHARLGMKEKLHPFPTFMAFLAEERLTYARQAEQQPSVKKSTSRSSHAQSTDVNQGKKNTGGKFKSKKGKYFKCAVHKSDGHVTRQCKDFIKLDFQGRIEKLRSVGACFRCFGNHRRSTCTETEPCEACGKDHHTLLCKMNIMETAKSDGNSNIVATDSNKVGVKKSVGFYAIASVAVKSSRRRATVFLDNGSDSSYITERAAKSLGARKLEKYLLNVTTTGGVETSYESQQYELDLIANSGRIVTVKLFSIVKITGKLAQIDLSLLEQIFPGYDCSMLQREQREVDILLGTDYFGVHPKHEVCGAGENLSIMSGAFGICLQGSHPLLQEESAMDSNFVKILKSADLVVASVDVNFTSSIPTIHPLFVREIGPMKEKCISNSHLTRSESLTIKKYIEGEELATQVMPRCGACKCGTCAQPGHTYSYEEEAQLKLIQNNLTYSEDEQCWRTSYPWKQDPATLPDNKRAVVSCLHRLENKLQKNPELARTYEEQIVDMVKRGVARKLTQQEEDEYEGPRYYIAHLGVPNPKSKSTPYRIVFNSSQKFKGTSLNEMLFKGPDAYLNNQLGIMLRWREEAIAIAGDVRKMYNSVHLELMEQHCHRFLWSHLDSTSTPSTYVITRVNMGDRPAGAIATEALYKTADMFSSHCPEAADFIKTGSYVDDLLNSVRSMEAAKKLTSGTEEILARGNFAVKFWIYSGEVDEENYEVEVLGIPWRPQPDMLVFNLSLNFSPKRHGVHTLPDLTEEEIPAQIPQILTKRSVLAQVMRIYDPLGLLSPFTISGKILLRSTWKLGLGWDDPLPSDLHCKWVEYFIHLYDANKLTFPRAMRPADAVGDPMLILFSDASDQACGFVAYARWHCSDGVFRSRLILSKGRIAPLVRRSTPQLELNAAVMSKRGREVIEKEMRYSFSKVLHLIDSETLLAMLQNTHIRYPLYEGLRIGEIQSAKDGDISEWAWVAGSDNPADLITRGKNPLDLNEDSSFFTGASFLSEPEDKWPIRFKTSSPVPLPGKKVVVNSNVAEAQAEVYNYDRVSKYSTLVAAVARAHNVVEKKNVKAMYDPLSPDLLRAAELLIVKDVQQRITSECEKQHKKRVGGNYWRFKPVKVNGIWVVGTRLVFNPMVPENEPQMLLPTKHRLTTLLMVQAHRETIHGGRDPTLARFRQRFWIPQGNKVAASVVDSCQLCKIRRPKLLSQMMGLLPMERSMPSPPFTYVMVDYFGPYKVRGEVQKRISGKAYGVLFTDLVSRAVFIEAVFDYSASSFLMALSKFASVRGYPKVIYSDGDTKLTCVSRELEEQWSAMWEKEGDRIRNESAAKGLEWRFSSADSPWQNGAVESLVKSVKKAIHFSIHEQRLSPTEFSCVMYEVANAVNERPIGAFTSSDSELSILTPNSLLLGRSQAKNPSGWQPDVDTSLLRRYHLIQEISNMFWKQWIRTYAPTLMVDNKWQTEPSRELRVGDVVQVLDDSAIKAEYRLAVVREVYPGADGRVRKVMIVYKHYKVQDTAVEYTGSTEQKVIRPVQRLVLIVPSDNSK